MVEKDFVEKVEELVEEPVVDIKDNTEEQPAEETKDNNVLEVEYYRPKFWKRMSAGFFDAVIFVLLMLIFIVCIQSIEHKTSKYIENNATLNDYYLSSGLYLDNGDDLPESIVDYYQDTTDVSDGAKVIFYRNAIETFFEFIADYADEDTYAEILATYDTARLDEELTYNGYAYFVIDEDSGEIVKNPDYTIPSAEYVDNFYEPYISSTLRGYLVTVIPDVLELEKYFAYLILFLDIPVSLTLAYAIVYLVIPLCLGRGKKTLGRLIFHLGLVDQRVLSVTWKRYLVRWLIMFFVEIVLSVMTLCVPLLVSITMMVFTKRKQNFHDYMLGIDELDDENQKIYKNLGEFGEKPSKSKYDIDTLKISR